VSSAPAVDAAPSAVPYTTAQHRIISAALELFAQHGVNGTSLQMIADAIGVTKAAVYHQFRTKNDIVVAAADVELERLEAALNEAEAEPGRSQALEVLLSQLIDIAVKRRRIVSILMQGDPVIVRVLAEQASLRRLMDRLYCLLTDDDPGAEARVRAAMFSAAIHGAVMHPLVVDLDDDTLHAHLLPFARRLLNLPEPASPARSASRAR
jgi:AcrR family transcriptional regulator